LSVFGRRCIIDNCRGAMKREVSRLYFEYHLI
jgi:hypothetical protein